MIGKPESLARAFKVAATEFAIVREQRLVEGPRSGCQGNGKGTRDTHYLLVRVTYGERHLSSE